MDQFDSCISSKPFRAWLFIRHVDPVKRIQRQPIKNLHFWTLEIVHYQEPSPVTISFKPRAGANP